MAAPWEAQIMTNKLLKKKKKKKKGKKKKERKGGNKLQRKALQGQWKYLHIFYIIISTRFFTWRPVINCLPLTVCKCCKLHCEIRNAFTTVVAIPSGVQTVAAGDHSRHGRADSRPRGTSATKRMIARRAVCLRSSLNTDTPC